MSSGYGLRANLSRCFPHYHDFATCLTTDPEPLKQCAILQEDYLECLHQKKLHDRKEVLKAKAEAIKSGIPEGHGGGTHH